MSTPWRRDKVFAPYRDYGGFYTDTQGEIPDTAKERSTDYRAPTRVRAGSTRRIDSHYSTTATFFLGFGTYTVTWVVFE